MFFPVKNLNRNDSSGFTLIELLIVVLILAAIAGAVITNYDGVGKQARYDTTKFEMAEIRKALLQFRRDSGSHDFPTQGVYDCTDFSNGGSITDPNINFPLTFSSSVDVPATMTKAEFITWCKATDNFWMLFIDPFERAKADQWNEDTHRGWNGPYLQNKYGAVSNSSIANIPSVKTPYQTPYFMISLENDSSAALVSKGENNTLGTVTGCNSTDNDDSVVCLLK